jgi:hypothetical protein
MGKNSPVALSFSDWRMIKNGSSLFSVGNLVRQAQPT